MIDNKLWLKIYNKTLTALTLQWVAMQKSLEWGQEEQTQPPRHQPRMGDVALQQDTCKAPSMMLQLRGRGSYKNTQNTPLSSTI